jgi:hypothetical protein
MRPAASLSRRFLAAAALWAATAVGAVPARADDPPAPAPAPAPSPAAGSAVAKLTAEESAMLARRFPDWERKPAAEREKIATNVLRLRELTAEQRARFFERLRRAQEAGPAVLADLPDRLAAFNKLRPEERTNAKEGGRIERAILGAVRAKVAPATLAAMDGLPPPERMLLGAGVLAEFRRRAGQVAGLSLRDRLRAAAGAVPPPGPDLRPDARAAHERALQTAMADAFPAARDAVAADLDAAAAKGREGLFAYAKQHAPAPPRGPTLWNAVNALERGRELLPEDARAKVDEAQAALLQALKVSDEDLARFRAAPTSVERSLFLWDLQQRLRRPGDRPPK